MGGARTCSANLRDRGADLVIANKGHFYEALLQGATVELARVYNRLGDLSMETGAVAALVSCI